MPESADELFEDLARDRDEAWPRLVDRYKALVWSIPTRRGLSSADAEEVFQNTWVLVYRHLEWIQKPRSISSWLITTAGREASKLIRRRARQREVETMHAADAPTIDDAAPEDAALQLERAQLVRDGIHSLGKRCRTLLERLYLAPDQPSYEHVAKELGMPLGSVGPTRIRCLAQLSELLSRLGL